MENQTRRRLTAAGLTLALATAGVSGYVWSTRAHAQQLETTTAAGNPPAGAPAAVPQTPALKDAATLQTAFAQVAKTTEPAVVTITTMVRQPRMTTRSMPRMPFNFGPFGGGNPFGANPFGDEDPFGGAAPRGFRGQRPQFQAPDDSDSDGFQDQRYSGPGAKGAARFQPVQEVESGLGSGFIFDKSGLIMTNAHVVKGASSVTVKLPDGREFKNAKVLGSDTQADIAVIKINADNLPAVTLGDSSKIDIGDWAIAVGNPFGLSNTLTVGVISAKAREVPLDQRSPGDYLQTDASINPGNSGGPLLDIYGRVVGVNNAIYSPTGGNVGIGFAIPINTAKNIADQLVKEGRVRRARLGIGIDEIGERGQAFGLPAGTQGVLVGLVEPNGPAAKAGLQPGDVITEINGEKVTRSAELQRKVAASPIGSDARLTVLRNGKTMPVTVHLEEAPEDARTPRVTPRQPNADDSGESIDNAPKGLGVRIAPLTSEMIGQLRLKNDAKGVVVVGVEQDSPAETAGLRPGDLIVRVGQTPVNTPDDVKAAVKHILDGESGDNKSVALYITRGTSSQYVIISL